MQYKVIYAKFIPDSFGLTYMTFCPFWNFRDIG